MRFVAALFAAAIAATAAIADPRLEWAKCKLLADSSARLACFDAVGVPARGWRYEKHVDPIDDREVRFLQRVATDDGRVSLLLRCLPGDDIVPIVGIEHSLGYDRGAGLALTIRFDSAPPESEHVSFNNPHLLFFPTEAVTRGFMRRLFAAKRLALRFSTRSGDERYTAVIDLDGLEAAIKPLRELCPAR